jgi:vancomycin resistance protein VanJ
MHGSQKYDLLKRVMRLCALAARVYPALLLALSVQHKLFPRRSGLLVLTQIFAPYLYLPLLLSLPLALRKRAGLLLATLSACLAVFVARFAPGRRQRPTEREGAVRVSVLNWNVEWGGDPEQIRPLLLSRPADIVTFEESSWEWIGRDAEITRLYPYCTGHMQDHPPGIVFLSSYPIVESQVSLPPNYAFRTLRMAAAVLDLGEERRLAVVVGHPTPPRFRPPPHIYEASLRDLHIREIRIVVDRFIERGLPVLLIGDFNVTEREPAYEELSRGLVDAHLKVGRGWGHTWRPVALKRFKLPLLRLDYLFSSPNVRPLSILVDTSRRGSDHYIVRGRFELQ